MIIRQVLLDIEAWPKDGRQPVDDGLLILMPGVVIGGPAIVTEISHFISWERRRDWFSVIEAGWFEEES